jgi:hypothetical protein
MGFPGQPGTSFICRLEFGFCLASAAHITHSDKHIGHGPSGILALVVGDEPYVSLHSIGADG